MEGRRPQRRKPGAKPLKTPAPEPQPIAPVEGAIVLWNGAVEGPPIDVKLPLEDIWQEHLASLREIEREYGLATLSPRFYEHEFVTETLRSIYALAGEVTTMINDVEVSDLRAGWLSMHRVLAGAFERKITARRESLQASLNERGATREVDYTHGVNIRAAVFADNDAIVVGCVNMICEWAKKTYSAGIAMRLHATFDASRTRAQACLHSGAVWHNSVAGLGCAHGNMRQWKNTIDPADIVCATVGVDDSCAEVLKFTHAMTVIEGTTLVLLRDYMRPCDIAAIAMFSAQYVECGLIHAMGRVWIYGAGKTYNVWTHIDACADKVGLSAGTVASPEFEGFIDTLAGVLRHECAEAVRKYRGIMRAYEAVEDGVVVPWDVATHLPRGESYSHAWIHD